MEHEQKVQTIENSMTDPVCNMHVDKQEALQHDFEGKTYYFCSEKCQSKFSAAPHLYTSSNKEIQPPVGHEKASHSTILLSQVRMIDLFKTPRQFMYVRCIQRFDKIIQEIVLNVV